jgi:hypothetical protein
VELLRENPSVDTTDSEQWVSPYSGSVLLDPTPTGRGGTDYRRALPVGGVFRSADGLVSVRVVRATATGATVVVRSTATGQLGRTASFRGPQRVGKRRPFTVGTTVTDAAATPMPYTNVTLQRRVGHGRWSTVTTTRTGVDGTASVRTSTAKAASYRWAFKAGTATRHSATKAVRLKQ